MPDLPTALDLTFNPFEPAASGPPIGIPFSPSGALESRLRNLVPALARTRGSKAIVILGDYGAGKTCLLAGRAKGKAIEKAAAEGIPDRMRSPRAPSGSAPD